MKQSKEYYTKLNYNGYKWCYYNSNTNLHHFSKKTDKGFDVIRCEEEQLHNGDMEFMVEHNISK